MQNSELYNFGINCYNFGLVMFEVLHSRKLKLCRGGMFSVEWNSVKIMIVILDVQYYVLTKLMLH